MSIQKEFDVRNPLCERLSMVESKHNSAMQCANPQCSKELLYLREGTLELLELESPSDNQFRPDEGAFATRPLPNNFFGFVVSARRHTSLGDGQPQALS